MLKKLTYVLFSLFSLDVTAVVVAVLMLSGLKQTRAAEGSRI
jgi:hypothetical protein